MPILLFTHADISSLKSFEHEMTQEWFSGSLILLNYIFIGWHTQMMASRAIENTSQDMDPHVKLGPEKAHNCVSTSDRANLY